LLRHFIPLKEREGLKKLLDIFFSDDLSIKGGRSKWRIPYYLFVVFAGNKKAHPINQMSFVIC